MTIPSSLLDSLLSSTCQSYTLCKFTKHILKEVTHSSGCKEADLPPWHLGAVGSGTSGSCICFWALCPTHFTLISLQVAQRCNGHQRIPRPQRHHQPRSFVSGKSLPFTLLFVLFPLQGGPGCFSEDNFCSALPLPGHSPLCFVSPLWLLKAAFFSVSCSLGTVEHSLIFFFLFFFFI